MTSQLHTVALLPHAATGINGIFRVHLPPTSLEKAGLQIGQHCELYNIDDRVVGYGIAWRATDRSKGPADRSVKLTETAQNSFSISNGTQIKILPAKHKITSAKSISLTDITPAEYSWSPDLDDDLWLTRIRGALSQAEALAQGLEFDLPPTEPTSRKVPRRRFKIESIDDAPTSKNRLTRFTDRTIIELAGASSTVTDDRQEDHVRTSTVESTAVKAKTTPVVVGGLTEQLDYIQKCVREVLRDPTKSDDWWARHPNFVHALLINGPEGTGKTTLLNYISSLEGFIEIFKLDVASLRSKPVKDQPELITSLFNSALLTQPSLLIIDDLHTIAQPANPIFTTSIVEAFASIKGTRVMVAAATRSTRDINPALLTGKGFFDVMELSMPDERARQQILTAIGGGDDSLADSSVTAVLAQRTQGFNASDLERLYHSATRAGGHRYDENDVSAQMIDPLSRFEDALRRIQPSALGGIGPEIPTTKWSDIGGSQHVQAQFDSSIGSAIRRPDLIRLFKCQPPKGVLLYGPPGCSKTLTARAVANSYNYRFIAIKGAELLNKYVGESERAVRDVFMKARAVAPCIIFFDEIDSIGKRRGGNDGGDANVHVLSTLLNEIDGFEQLKDVLILAATNIPQELDDALIRPGRFDHHIYIGPPSIEARKEIFAINTDGVPMSKGLIVDHLLEQMDGYSGAEMVDIISGAKVAAVARFDAGAEDAEPCLTSDDFMHALQSVRKGITPEMLQTYDDFRQSRSK